MYEPQASARLSRCKSWVFSPPPNMCLRHFVTQGSFAAPCVCRQALCCGSECWDRFLLARVLCVALCGSSVSVCVFCEDFCLWFWLMWLIEIFSHIKCFLALALVVCCMCACVVGVGGVVQLFSVSSFSVSVSVCVRTVCVCDRPVVGAYWSFYTEIVITSKWNTQT